MNRGFERITSPLVLYPQSVVIFSTNLFVIQGCGGSLEVNAAGSTSAAYNTEAIQTTPGIGDVIGTHIFCHSGIYDFIHMGATFSNRGILGYELDGIRFLTGQDWYSSGAVYNVKKTGEVSIANPGTHLLRIMVESKNGSSSSYAASLTYMTFIRKQAELNVGI